MKHSKYPLRPAIAMIELIFAIVIMGIVLMSVPNLVRTAEKSGYVAIQQEAINEAAAHLNMILGYHWDENDTDERFLDPILRVGNGDNELDEYVVAGVKTGRRKGTPKESLRSFVRSDGARLDASSIGLDAGESKGDEDDIDDFNDQPYHLVLVENSPFADYIEKETQIDINTSVSYATDSANYNSPSIQYDFDSAGTPTTNVKRITVTLTSSSGQDELSKTITLKAFSCNIGATELEERSF